MRAYSHWLEYTTILTTALFIFISVQGCDTGGGTEEEDPPAVKESVELSQESVPSLHDKFRAMSERIPDFGGLYINDEGRLIVYLLDPGSGRRDEVKAALEEVSGLGLEGLAENPRRSIQTPEVELREARYPMEDLLEWYDRLGRLFEDNEQLVEQLVLMDLQERSNNLAIGVRDRSIEDQLRSGLEELDIPQEAVEVVEAVPPTPDGHDLRSRVRPTLGGIEIGQAGSSTVCTMGFNVSYKGTFGFLTNSHCTNQRGNGTGTRFTNPGGGGRIAQEHVDPNYNTCFFAFSCRYSDAAFVDYNGGTGGRNKIARPQNWAAPNSGSSTLDIDHGSSLDVTGLDAHPVSGEMVDKVGRTTGWTYGFVNRTCFRTTVSNGSGGAVAVNGKTVLMRCQYRANYTSSGGDSGSPVFDWHGSTVTLYGLNWGSGPNGAVFSPWQGIKKDF